MFTDMNTSETCQEHVSNEADPPKKVSRMVCVVPGCSQRYAPGQSFHGFPRRSDKERWKTWVQNLRLKIEPAASARVCGSHFSIKNFVPPCKYCDFFDSIIS